MFQWAAETANISIPGWNANRHIDYSRGVVVALGIFV
jgi:hypothetical protein